VLPIAQRGAQEVFASYSKKPQIFPRKTLRVTAGKPIVLSDVVGKQITNDSLRKGTEHMMAVVTGMLAEMRGEEPPAVPFDPAAPKAVSDQKTASDQAAPEQNTEPDQPEQAPTGPGTQA
jgi:hypothetical protein